MVNSPLVVIGDKVSHAGTRKLTDISEMLTASIIRAIALTEKEESTSKTLVSFYHTTRGNVPENMYLHS
jgi:hypothetical protein